MTWFFLLAGFFISGIPYLINRGYWGTASMTFLALSFTWCSGFIFGSKLFKKKGRTIRCPSIYNKQRKPFRKRVGVAKK